ncbi:hypothetical protein HY440_00025 [Candidatus Microgenomates bacterium]|nr:hypothetical protein [Candidatus Microgenomates bacterium]
MKFGQKILLFYGSLLSVFITFGAGASGNWLATIFFLPVVAHFTLVLFAPQRKLRLLLAYDFILTTIMTITGFIAARSVPQFVSAALFAPLALYFWQLILPRRSRQFPVTELGFEILEVVPQRPARLKKVPQPEEKTGRHFDMDRRMFLKLIGSAGLTLFMFSVFTKKAEAAFFGSVPGPGTVALKDTTGALVDPAIKQPTDGYKITEIDDSTPAYYGFVNKDGAWFIMKEDSTATPYYSYTKGDTSFSTNWTGRAGLTYGYFDAIF